MREIACMYIYFKLALTHGESIILYYKDDDISSDPFGLQSIKG